MSKTYQLNGCGHQESSRAATQNALDANAMVANVSECEQGVRRFADGGPGDSQRRRWLADRMSPAHQQRTAVEKMKRDPASGKRERRRTSRHAG